MTLRCKPGDIAVVVHPDNQGALVRVLCPSSKEQIYQSAMGCSGRTR